MFDCHDMLLYTELMKLSLYTALVFRAKNLERGWATSFISSPRTKLFLDQVQAMGILVRTGSRSPMSKYYKKGVKRSTEFICIE